MLDLTRDNTETNRQFFSPALPKREQFDTELEPWKNECSEVPRAERKKAKLLETLQLIHYFAIRTGIKGSSCDGHIMHEYLQHTCCVEFSQLELIDLLRIPYYVRLSVH